MARNDQAVRLLVVLKQLEASRQGLTLEQLAESLAPGSTRHPRTLRRDLAALEEAGYPLVTERINGHTCWRLMEGFRNVPGLRFSPSELMALTFSRRFIRSAQYQYCLRHDLSTVFPFHHACHLENICSLRMPPFRRKTSHYPRPPSTPVI